MCSVISSRREKSRKASRRWQGSWVSKAQGQQRHRKKRNAAGHPKDKEGRGEEIGGGELKRSQSLVLQRLRAKKDQGGNDTDGSLAND